jgi:very-short-patch-repair endonuclease
MPPQKRPRKLPYSPLLKNKARKLRNQPTPAEKRFWNNLRKMPFYETVNFNRQKTIGNYIVDFYCHQFRLVIEIDGDSHGQPLTQTKDVERTGFLNSKGLAVLRFTNLDIEKNIEAVMMEIENFVEKGKSPQPPS